MHGLESLKANNTRETIKAIIARGRQRGVRLTRQEVLEELDYAGEDNTAWSATIDRLLGIR